MRTELSELVELLGLNERNDLLKDRAAIAEQDKDQSWRKYQVPWNADRVGMWRISKFFIPEDDAHRWDIISRQGPSRDPGYGGMTKLQRLEEDGLWHVWMSDSRAEIYEHYEFFRAIESEVLWGPGFGMPKEPYIDILINGLGLGVAVRGALLNPYVRHIDVVELVPEVIDLLSPHLPAKRVTVHNADAYQIQWPVKKRWHLAWHDIWKNISPANIPGMTKLHRKYGRKVGWQGSWRKDSCYKMREIERRIDEKYGHFMKKEAEPTHDQVKQMLLDPDVRTMLGIEGVDM